MRQVEITRDFLARREFGRSRRPRKWVGVRQPVLQYHVLPRPQVPPEIRVAQLRREKPQQ